MKTGRAVGGALAVSVAVTVLALLRPEAAFAVRSPALHAAVEMTAGSVAFGVAVLAYGRFRRRGGATDVLLAAAFGVFASVNVAFSTVSVIAAGFIAGFGVWAPLAGRVLATALFAAAAFQSADRRMDERSAHLLLVATALAVALIGVTVAVLGPQLPAGIGLLPGERPTFAALGAHPAVAASQALAIVLLVASVAGFARQARQGYRLGPWLAAAAVLSAAARVHFLLYPSLYSDLVYSGDWLRLGFYGTVLAAGVAELGAYWRELASTAALEERRRLAHDLHDGLAQELALIAGQARVLAKRDPSPQLELIAAAAQRALDESRRAIAALTRPLDQPLHQSLTTVVEDLATRLRIDVELELARGVRVPPLVEEAMLRIVREAVANAAHHSQTSHIAVTLTGRSHVRLVIFDDGVGFDPASAPRGRSGFGLAGMAEQAAAAGLRFRIRSAPGSGTRVEVEAR